MGVIRVAEGSTVRLKNDGRVGKVIALTAEKTGGRGRPATYAAVMCDDGSECSCSVRELSLI